MGTEIFFDGRWVAVAGTAAAVARVLVAANGDELVRFEGAGQDAGTLWLRAPSVLGVAEREPARLRVAAGEADE